MTMQRSALVVFLVLCALCVAHALYFYPQLPDTVASHFGARGEPDNWSGKGTFLGLHLVVMVVTAVTFLGIAWGVPHMPDDMVNLPNKAYWLAPERRQETFGFLSGAFLWFGSATLLLLLDTAHQSFRVHLGRAPALQHAWLSLGLYVGFTALWCVGLAVRFLRTKNREEA